MIAAVAREARLVSAAIVYLTRVRLPFRIVAPFPDIEAIAKYFPLVGIFVGAMGAAVYVLALRLWTHEIAVFLSMAATTLATGAFHEDGFADVCDGIGGGWTKEHILTIMKDSRVGAFGAIGMNFMLLGKFLALAALPSEIIVPVLIGGHAISRAMGCLLAFTLSYARPAESLGEKPVMKDLKAGQALTALAWGVLPFAFFTTGALWKALLILPVVYFSFRAYIKRWIGGYTGDCCGALQQLGEVVFYLAVGALL